MNQYKFTPTAGNCHEMTVRMEGGPVIGCRWLEKAKRPIVFLWPWSSNDLRLLHLAEFMAELYLPTYGNHTSNDLLAYLTGDCSFCKMRGHRAKECTAKSWKSGHPATNALITKLREKIKVANAVVTKKEKDAAAETWATERDLRSKWNEEGQRECDKWFLEYENDDVALDEDSS